jgi:uncharacterized protein YcfJ
MKTSTLTAALILTLSAAAASAGHYRPSPKPAQFFDQARVVSSIPVYEEVNAPRQECWVEQTGYEYETRDRKYGGTVLGTLLGGAIGHQIGKGHGRDAATAVGAVIGAVAGSNADNRDSRTYRRPVEEERCRTVDNWTRRITGYDVVYRYQGNEYSTFLNYDPGSTLRLQVSFSIADRR